MGKSNTSDVKDGKTMGLTDTNSNFPTDCTPG